MGEALTVCSILPNRQTCLYVTAVVLVKKKKKRDRTKNTSQLNCPFVSWAFPLSDVLLYVLRFLCWVRFWLWYQLLPFVMERNRPVLLLVVSILVSAKFAFPKAFRSGTTDSFSLMLAVFQCLQNLAVFSIPHSPGERGCLLAAPSFLFDTPEISG